MPSKPFGCKISICDVRVSTNCGCLICVELPGAAKGEFSTPTFIPMGSETLTVAPKFASRWGFSLSRSRSCCMSGFSFPVTNGLGFIAAHVCGLGVRCNGFTVGIAKLSRVCRSCARRFTGGSGHAMKSDCKVGPLSIAQVVELDGASKVVRTTVSFVSGGGRCESALGRFLTVSS